MKKMKNSDLFYRSPNCAIPKNFNVWHCGFFSLGFVKMLKLTGNLFTLEVQI